MFEPILDHAVVDVRNGLDEAASLFRRLGFALTARGYHTLGSANHLAVFRSNYLELLGWERDSDRVRAELSAYPVGLNGLVFRTDDADTMSAALATSGLPAQLPTTLSRPVRLANGAQTEARFRTVRFEPGTFGSVRAYFCEHFTPELIWRDEHRQHGNAAVDIVRVLIQAANPDRLGTLFATMFGEDRTRLDGDGCILEASNARIEIRSRVEITQLFPDSSPDLGGRDEAMAALTIRSADLGRTAAVLAAGKIPTMQIGAGRIVVPARAALNVTLEFVE
jgi:hypothetical protein